MVKILFHSRLIDEPYHNISPVVVIRHDDLGNGAHQPSGRQPEIQSGNDKHLCQIVPQDIDLLRRILSSQPVRV